MINRICTKAQAYIHGCLNYIWWFNFKCLQLQITWRASVWLCASAAQTGCVSTCVCWLCANRRQRQRDSQTKMFHGWQRWTIHIIHLRVNLSKSFLTAQVRSHYGSCWWYSLKNSLKMQNTCKYCLCCYFICPILLFFCSQLQCLPY